MYTSGGTTMNSHRTGNTGWPLYFQFRAYSSANLTAVSYRACCAVSRGVSVSTKKTGIIPASGDTHARTWLNAPVSTCRTSSTSFPCWYSCNSVSWSGVSSVMSVSYSFAPKSSIPEPEQ